MRTGDATFRVVNGQSGRRLTASFFLPRDVAAAPALASSTLPRTSLEQLCVPGGIFKGGIFKRIMAKDGQHGRPYVMPSQLERVDVGVSRYLSNLHGELLDQLALTERMILVTRSGKTLGKVLFARRDLDGLVASDDLIRVVANPTAVHPGYLFAYLASPIGQVVIHRQIYGTSVVHIEPEHLFDLPVLRLGSDRENSIGESVLQAQASIARGVQELASTKALLATLTSTGPGHLDED